MPIYTIAQAIELPEEPVNWLVEQLFVKGQRNLIYGEWGSFKSLILADLSLHLAAGKPWMGFSISLPRKVVYIDEEMTQDEMIRRYKRIMVGAGIQLADVAGRLELYSQESVRLNPLGVAQLTQQFEVRGFMPDVVILESMRRVIVGQENEASDVAAMWRACNPLVTKGISLFISHHMTKPPIEGHRSVYHRASGSTDLIAGADSAWAIERPDRESNMVRVTGAKTRTTTAPGPLNIQVEFREDPTLGPIVISRVEGLPRSTGEGLAMRLVETYIETHELSRTSDMLALCEVEGLSSDMFERALKLLRDFGRVESPAKGLWKAVKLPNKVLN